LGQAERRDGLVQPQDELGLQIVLLGIGNPSCSRRSASGLGRRRFVIVVFLLLDQIFQTLFDQIDFRLGRRDSLLRFFWNA